MANLDMRIRARADDTPASPTYARASTKPALTKYSKGVTCGSTAELPALPLVLSAARPPGSGAKNASIILPRKNTTQNAQKHGKER